MTDVDEARLTAELEECRRMNGTLRAQVSDRDQTVRRLESEVSAFKQEVSERAYDWLANGAPCRDGMVRWLREHDCPVKTRSFTGTVTIEFTVSGTLPDYADADREWLTSMVSEASLELSGDLDDYDVDDWNVGQVTADEAEEAWE